MRGPWKSLISAGVGAAMTAGCAAGGAESPAAAGEAGGKTCFWLSQVSGFSDAGDNRIRVSVGPNEDYIFETFGPCPDLDFAEKLALEQVGPGMICQGMDVNLIVPSPIGPTKCPVRLISRVPPAER